MRIRLKFLYLSCFWFTKFKNSFIFNGKKQKAEKIFNTVFIELKFKYRYLPLLSFYEVIEKLKSPFILFPFRRGIKIYILPNYIVGVKQYTNSIYWLVKDIKKESNKIGIRVTIKGKFEEFILLKSADLFLEENNNFKLISYKTIVDNRIHLHYRW